MAHRIESPRSAPSCCRNYSDSRSRKPTPLPVEDRTGNATSVEPSRTGTMKPIATGLEGILTDSGNQSIGRRSQKQPHRNFSHTRPAKVELPGESALFRAQSQPVQVVRVIHQPAAHSWLQPRESSVSGGRGSCRATAKARQEPRPPAWVRCRGWSQ